MGTLAHVLSDYLYTTVEFTIVLIEFYGLFIIAFAILKEFYNSIYKYKFDFEKMHDETHLNTGLATALEILLAAEILKTLVVTNYSNLIMVAALIVLRIIISLILVRK